MRVLRRPLAIVAVLFGLDYLVWLWSLGGSRGAIGLVAGPLLVILGFALLWLMIKQLARALTSTRLRPRSGASARNAAGGAGSVRYRESTGTSPAGPDGGVSPSDVAQTPVGSGSSPSAQIAA